MKTTGKYYENGQIEERYTVNKDNKKHGLYETWYDNGQQSEKSNWKNGNRYGLSEIWWDNGHSLIKSTFKDGQRHGICEMWRYDGTPRTKEYYVDDKKVSQEEWEEYCTNYPTEN